MLKNLKRKLAAILSTVLTAVMASTLAAAVQAGNTAYAADCSVNMTEEEVQKMDKAALNQCKNQLENGDCKAPSGENKDACSKALKLIEDAKTSKLIKKPVDEYIKDAPYNIKDVSDPKNQCLEEKDNNKITAVIEEPLEGIETIDTDTNAEIRSCIRNTVCVKREDTTGFQCVSYLNKAEFCSPNAADAMTAKNTAEKTSVTLHCSQVQVFLSQSGIDMLFMYIGAIYKWAAGITGIIAVLIIVISGIQISAAAGDQQAVTNARNRILQAVGGLTLLFLSGIILYTINPTFFTAG